MNGCGEPPARHALSTDGTEIAYWTSGAGPALVLVHGTTADHTRWRPLLPYLEPHLTIHAMDRRGRGSSGDGADYSWQQEAEDVAAVVDAVADTTSRRVDVYGHSYGGLCAFGAAAMSAAVRRLVLYEGWPSVDPTSAAMPAGLISRMEAHLAAGDREAVVDSLFRELLQMPDAEIVAFRALSSWQARIAAAHTVPRELRALELALLDLEQAARISAPTLLLTGSDSPDASASEVARTADSLADARIVVLEGQQHVADLLAPRMVAEHILAFLLGDS